MTTPRDASLSAADTTIIPDRAEQAKWFTKEVQPYGAELKAYLRGAFPAVRDVDDVVQESYVRIWKARAAHPIRSARAFLFQVARHVALNLVDRQRISPVFTVGDLAALPVIEDKPGVAESTEQQERLAFLVEALATLPPRCREITILRKLKGMPQKEVAELLGISERTVEEQVARGVRRCEDFLRKRGISSHSQP
ncbi:MAG: sigma-70 family RNA polymerase sigma factor [Opitutae bacterium]|nr:sigma-70 family RNA polymerase sigma factor [Opitutae bacterium]